ncbi:MAG TPA: hypothetical protein VFO83_15970 [Aggregicoccus sp.]|nr:hypothetical protein [Aggregicoccus sp.]
MSRLKRSILAVVTLSLALPACQDPVDKAAKERIFSPEDPPKTVTAAAEPLPPGDVAEDARVARRILGMDTAEATERLGPHLYTADLVTEWVGGTGGVKLTEKRTLRAGAGGVAGDFHGVVENSRDQGLEVLRVDGKVYARNRYGTFRQRTRDRGMAERTRAELTGALHDFDELFRGRLKLSPLGTGTHEGRSVQRYGVSLAPMTPGAATPPDEAELPAALAPKNGQDETTRRRAAFFALREPRSLQGEVWVDARTSVVLKASLDGRLSVPGAAAGADAGAGEAELHLTLQSARTEIGKAPELQVPTSFLPDADKPQGIADALDRFGVPRAGLAKPDAGAAEAAPEPEDEEAN